MMALGRALLAIVFAASLASLAAAQSYPDRPVKIIVAYGPGTVTDVLVRLLADKIGPRLNQSIVVENRGGAGGVSPPPRSRRRRPTATRCLPTRWAASARASSPPPMIR